MDALLMARKLAFPGDTRYVYAVKITGVYCRPSCSSRLLRRANVMFFGTSVEAERARSRHVVPLHRHVVDRIDYVCGVQFIDGRLFDAYDAFE
jgi:hypothetical protein